ncbi:MAG: hypothetical protein KY468_17000 [Armatimonadetes bacterium]|nr:hypothetical protein [Armatimonadota bacterium]
MFLIWVWDMVSNRLENGYALRIKAFLAGWFILVVLIISHTVAVEARDRSRARAALSKWCRQFGDTCGLYEVKETWPQGDGRIIVFARNDPHSEKIMLFVDGGSEQVYLAGLHGWMPMIRKP